DTLMKARSAIALVQVALMGRRLLKAGAADVISASSSSGRPAPGRTIEVTPGVRDPRDMIKFSKSAQREVQTALDQGTGQVRVFVGPKAGEGKRAWVSSPIKLKGLLHTHPGSKKPNPSPEDWDAVNKRYEIIKGGKGTYFEGIIGEEGIKFFGFLEGKRFELFRPFVGGGL
ncbi:MAG: hypothetical protein N3A38_17035, partial [Planctomycetota bacterium]|nr:hypothetical protein [Planctomycetota bacterium]